MNVFMFPLGISGIEFSLDSTRLAVGSGHGLLIFKVNDEFSSFEPECDHIATNKILALQWISPTEVAYFCDDRLLDCHIVDSRSMKSTTRRGSPSNSTSVEYRSILDGDTLGQEERHVPISRTHLGASHSVFASVRNRSIEVYDFGSFAHLKALARTKVLREKRRAEFQGRVDHVALANGAGDTQIASESAPLVKETGIKENHLLKRSHQAEEDILQSAKRVKTNHQLEKGEDEPRPSTKEETKESLKRGRRVEEEILPSAKKAKTNHQLEKSFEDEPQPSTKEETKESLKRGRRVEEEILPSAKKAKTNHQLEKSFEDEPQPSNKEETKESLKRGRRVEKEILPSAKKVKIEQ
jgi:hypothetical protein